MQQVACSSRSESCRFSSVILGDANRCAQAACWSSCRTRAGKGSPIKLVARDHIDDDAVGVADGTLRTHTPHHSAKTDAEASSPAPFVHK